MDLDLAAGGAEVESGSNKSFDLTEADMKFHGIDLRSNNSAVVRGAEDRIDAGKRVARASALG
jgi:hypothetical protein